MAANSNALTYSRANRLASASGAWGSEAFSYDGVGNRLSDVTAALNRQSLYAVGSNQIQFQPRIFAHNGKNTARLAANSVAKY